MILFIILLLTVIMLAVFTVAALAVGGASLIIVFGDVIVCAVFIVWIMKRLCTKNKSKK